MVNIAVAGGIGSVGKTIVDVLIQDARHNVTILSSQPRENFPVPVIAVNYQDPEALKDILEANEIHTVISAQSMRVETASRAQINLIRAAAAAKPTQRFIASEWGTLTPPDAPSYMPHIAYRLAAYEELSKTDLEWTRVYNGFFLDYYAQPHVRSHQVRLPFAIDVENKVAAIPGTGDEIATFTYTYDIARFVSALMDLPAGGWPEKSIVIGDKLSFNELLKLAEEARGCKFEVHYDSLEKLQELQVTELPGHKHLYPYTPKEQLQRLFAIFFQWAVGGHFDLPYEQSLNARFPEIKTVKAKEMLEEAWKGK
ncbi:NmrA-like family protein [Lasiodiplodia theobromae]|uniref:NmrA-like family protein n=1 Tax=Lasiodiplodia theobromae TaxID=45133 RepID=UPI0015C379A2|nr:NmrA-like family protein [Lasiodiplodia theobromae]KAF4534428.1 NmrA-like family protein [Lasiodiplodia theobromae]